MYLKRLEMQGFKSFANKTILEFNKGITAIIGPNGSGKSNISDCIRWVLGEQSIKNLRGSKSEDIIFAGTENRKSLGFAEVSIIFDNSDGVLPTEYTEVTITRRLYRTGETGYYINRVPCRLKDVNELFMDTGIGKDGYSIIGQGKIDEILSTKSEDRRHIFEEAAGIIKYRTRRTESEKKLEQTKLNLVRINDILSEIENNLEPLKVQSDKAKEFLKLHDELKEIEVGLFIDKINTYKEKLNHLINDKSIFENQNSDEEKKLKHFQNLKNQLKTEIDEITSQLEKSQLLKSESSTNIEKENSNISIANERIENNNQNISRLENEIQLSELSIEELKNEKNSRFSRNLDLKNNKEKFENELKEKEEKLNNLSRTLTKKEIEFEKKKSEKQNLIDNKYEYQNEITILETKIENNENRKDQEKINLSKIISELDSTRIKKNEISKQFSEIENENVNLKNEIDKSNFEKNKIETVTKDFEIKIENIKDEKRIAESKYKFLVEGEKENEGYAKSVKCIIEESKKKVEFAKGFSGVLANIISTDEKYKTAIEMALGNSLQNIVTETEIDAKKMIEYLRDNNIGRASFLPISAIRGKKLEGAILNDNKGFIGIASDLVSSSSKYNEIVSNLLGRTVIVNNIDSAIKLARQNHYSFRIVTLDGDIISNTGSMTGGATNKKSFSILGRNLEISKLENKINNLSKQINELENSKLEFLKENKQYISKLEELEQKSQEQNIVYATEKEKYNAIENNLNIINENKEKSKLLIENLEKEINELIEQKSKKESIIKSENEKIDILSNEIEEFSNKNKEKQKELNDLNLDITNLKISVSSFDESEASLNDIIERIEKDISNEIKKINNKKEEIKKSKDSNIELTKKIKEYEESIYKIKNYVSTFDEKNESLHKQRDDDNEKLNELEKSIESEFSTIQKLHEQLVKVDVKITEKEEQIENTTNELWDEYEITPNMENDFNKPTNIREAENKANELHDKIKELGSVNIDAIEEYKNTMTRYEEMNEQRLDLESTIVKIGEIIHEMTNKMKIQFSEKFELINKNFDEVFKELFGGGKAELILEDESNILECGIEIKAQPVGKKAQNMLLLSGGERALTAISLLFAILKINPSPLCVLDEIEAALDDVNVNRFANFLKQFCDNTQFLVITHRKGTMESAKTVYGVTMEENGISKLLSIKLNV